MSLWRRTDNGPMAGVKSQRMQQNTGVCVQLPSVVCVCFVARCRYRQPSTVVSGMHVK